MILTDPQLDVLAEMIADRVAERLKIQLAQKWVTREEYAQLTKLSLRQVDRMLKEERLKIRREGRRVFIESP